MSTDVLRGLRLRQKRPFAIASAVCDWTVMSVIVKVQALSGTSFYATALSVARGSSLFFCTIQGLD